MTRERKATEDRTQQESFERMCVYYLERYFYLLAFNGYLATLSQLKDADTSTFTFTEWTKSKSEIATLVHQMHSNPQQALKIELPSDPQLPAIPLSQNINETETLLIADENLRRENEIKRVILDRTGDVLVTNTILKADHFPGCQRKGCLEERMLNRFSSSKLTYTIAGLLPRLTGAPNFRRVDGIDVNVYGVAQCTIEGLAS